MSILFVDFNDKSISQENILEKFRGNGEVVDRLKFFYPKFSIFQRFWISGGIFEFPIGFEFNILVFDQILTIHIF